MRGRDKPQPLQNIMPRKIFIFLALIFFHACAPTPTPTSPSPSPVSTPTFFSVPPTSIFIEATPHAPLTVRGTFVYSAGDGSLWRQNTRGGEPTPLVERSTESIAQQPAFSPDGKQIAYSALLFLPDGNLRGDIRVIAADGKNARTLIQAEANEVVYFYPRFANDGRLLVTRAEKLQTTAERAQLEWVNVDGAGERTRVIENARDADVSRDGTRIAFIRHDVAAMRSSLWLANADGKDEKILVDDTTFAAILNPRFSPDGKWLAFGVHGAAQKSLPLLSRPVPFHLAARDLSSCVPVFLFPCFARTAHAHAAPGALWRVNLETGKFQQLTDVYDDSPVPAWSSDGTQLAIHDYTGIRLIDIARAEIYPLFLEDGGNGGFDWGEE